MLNIDLGELHGEPEELYGFADVANIACGGHAGDDASMARALSLCLSHGARAGAHPSYPDRVGFGRRPQDMAVEALTSTVIEQCRRLANQAARINIPINYMKPHGALYHAADHDPRIAEALIAGSVAALGAHITIIGPARRALESAARAAGLIYLREGFADRAVRADGTLVPRSEPGAIICNIEAVRSNVITLLLSRSVDTLCVHGDTPNAVVIAAAIRTALSESNYHGQPT